MATVSEQVTDAKQTSINRHHQSTVFLFWLILTTAASRVGVAFIKGIIENNRIPLEWIMLYAFTFGFLLTTSLTIDGLNDPHKPKPLDNQELLFEFSIVLRLIGYGLMLSVVTDQVTVPKQTDH